MQSSWELRNVTIQEVKDFVKSLNKSMSDFTILGYKKSVVPRVMMANYLDCVREHDEDLSKHYLTYENCSTNFTDEFRKELVDVDNCIADQDTDLKAYYLNVDNCSAFADNYITFDACDEKHSADFIKKYHNVSTCINDFGSQLIDQLVTKDQCLKDETVKGELIDELVTKEQCIKDETVKGQLIDELVTYDRCNTSFHEQFTTNLVTPDMCIAKNNQTLFDEYVTYNNCKAEHNDQFANDLITYDSCNKSFHVSFERDLVTVDNCVANLGDSLKDYYLNESSCAPFVTKDSCINDVSVKDQLIKELVNTSTCTAAGIGTEDYCKSTHGLIHPSQCPPAPGCTPINEDTCAQNGVGTESWCKNKYDIDTITQDKCLDYYGNDNAFKNAVCAGMETPSGGGFPAAVGYTLVCTSILFFGTTCALLVYVWKTKIWCISKDKTSKSIVKKVGGEEDKWPKP